MTKYLITAIAMRNGSQCGSWVVEVDSNLSIYSIERRYEREWNLDHPGEACKVIDIREVTGPLPQADGDCR